MFSGGRQTGQQVDFADFDNRTLAIMALNGDASFSAQEAGAAKRSSTNARAAICSRDDSIQRRRRAGQQPGDAPAICQDEPRRTQRLGFNETTPTGSRRTIARRPRSRAI